jgi:mono/diheme cytochrome c family protein
MKILKLCFIFSAIALFIFACSGDKPANNTTTANTNKPAANTNTPANTQPTAATDELAAAKKIYSEKCVRCHKEDGTGGETNIEGTKIKAPNFTSDRMRKETDQDFTETIENGEKDEGMPSFKGKLTEEEIKSLVKLIRRDFQKQ